MKRIFLFAGESSGDLHGSYLAKELKSNLSEVLIEGVPGPRMRLEGVQPVLKMEDFEVMGLTDVLCSLPMLYRHFQTVRNHILKTTPDVIVLIDYPGFNLRLAASLRKKGFKGRIVQYISPSVWAWGKHRIDDMSNHLDLLLTIYPFEAKYFNGYPLKVEYVGNPLNEYIVNHTYDDSWKQKIGMPQNNPIIALFPGSRKSEIALNMPFLLQAAEKCINAYPNTIIGLSCSHPEATIAFQKQMSPTLKQALFQVPKEYTYELMRDCTTAAAKSGTVTLELALHQIPTVVIYKTTWINRLYVKYFLKTTLPYYCIANILAGEQVFPELIEKIVTTEDLFTLLNGLHKKGSARTSCLEQCRSLQNSLGQHPASSRAAQLISDLISC